MTSHRANECSSFAVRDTNLAVAGAAANQQRTTACRVLHENQVSDCSVVAGQLNIITCITIPVYQTIHCQNKVLTDLNAKIDPTDSSLILVIVSTVLQKLNIKKSI